MVRKLYENFTRNPINSQIDIDKNHVESIYTLSLFRYMTLLASHEDGIPQTSTNDTNVITLVNGVEVLVTRIWDNRKDVSMELEWETHSVTLDDLANCENCWQLDRIGKNDCPAPYYDVPFFKFLQTERARSTMVCPFHEDKPPMRR